MNSPSRDPDLAVRAAHIIREAGYLSLATATPETGPWAAQLQYAWLTNSLRFVFGSHVAARHSRDIAATAIAAATVSTLPGSTHGLDGLQVYGSCRALSGTAVKATAPMFYEQMFPDAADAQQHALPISQLHGDGPHRLFELHIRELWILDLERWEREGLSTRRALDINAVETFLNESTGELRPAELIDPR